MGLYDSVMIEEMFCPFCGTELNNHDWQTKDTDSLMYIFDNLADMYDKYPDIGVFDICTICDNDECKEFISLQVRNESEEHKARMTQSIKEMQDRWSEEATSDHPNHEHDYMKHWCNKCPKETVDEKKHKRKIRK